MVLFIQFDSDIPYIPTNTKSPPSYSPFKYGVSTAFAIQSDLFAWVRVP